MCASRGTSEIPSPPATSPITACQSPAAVRDLRAEAGGAAAGEEHLVARPADAAARPSPRPRARRGRCGPVRRARDRSAAPRRATSPSSSSRWKRVSSRRGAAEHSMPRIRSTSRATSSRTASGVSASWMRSVTAGAAARSGRAAGASRPASAVGKPPIRTSPRGAEPCAARSPSSFSSCAKSASAWPSRTCAAGVSRTLRPDGSSSGWPTSRSSAESCWETAEGVRCSASAAAASVP